MAILSLMIINKSGGLIFQKSVGKLPPAVIVCFGQLAMISCSVLVTTLHCHPQSSLFRQAVPPRRCRSTTFSLPPRFSTQCTTSPPNCRQSRPPAAFRCSRRTASPFAASRYRGRPGLAGWLAGWLARGSGWGWGWAFRFAVGGGCGGCAFVFQRFREIFLCGCGGGCGVGR